MGEGTADERQRDGKCAASGRCELTEAKPDASYAMVEDANSQRVQADENGGVGSLRGSDAAASSCDTIGVLGDSSSMGRVEPIRAGSGTGDDDQIESSLVSEFGVQKPAMGSSSQPHSETNIEDSYDHLFTDAMKLQLRAQILVLGDFLKGIAPSPDWLEEACPEPGVGAEAVLPEPIDSPCGVPEVSYLQRISSAFQSAEAGISPFSGAADPPATTAAIKAELHAAERLSGPGDPSSKGKAFLTRDESVAEETDVAPPGQLMVTYDQTTAKSNSKVAEYISQATETRVHDNDRHLDLAQASAQDALTTATSALAQSHMVWARLHSQDRSAEGAARDARIASVAATVAAAASVAKAAVEAARAIAEVSMDAFIQAGGYQVGDTGLAQFGSTRSRPLQVTGWDQCRNSNTREDVTLSSQHRADMVESVVQAAGKAAEAATQAGVVLVKANPFVQTSGLSGFWSRKLNEVGADLEGNEYGEMNEANERANELDRFDGEGEVGALNEVDELDGGNEEGALEETEDSQKEGTASHEELDAVNGMGDVHEEDIANQDVPDEVDVARANGDDDGVAAANEAETFVANVDEVAGANEPAVAAAVEVAESIEQGKSIDPRSRKFKRGRGRGRSQGICSRAKRYKNLRGVSSAIMPAQTPENEMHQKDEVPEGQNSVRRGNARGKKRGARQMGNRPVSTFGKDTAVRGWREPENDRNTREGPEDSVEGSAVEVMADELGLRGGWFSGTVLRMTPNEAFVELHDLLTDDGKANVREWFPLVEGFNPYRPRRHVRPVHPFSIFTEAGSRKRRRVALGSQTWHIGDHVDAFFQDAWWEGIVAELNDLDSSKATIYFPEENDTQVVKTWDLRPSFQWKDKKWMPWKNPVLVEDERPQKRQKTGGSIKRSTKDGPDELIAQKSNIKCSKRGMEWTKMQEDCIMVPEAKSARKKSPIKTLQESKFSQKRSIRSKISCKRLKKFENKNASQKQNGRSTINRRRKAQQEDVLSPVTSKKLEFTMDTIAPLVDAALGKTSTTKAKALKKKGRMTKG